MLPKKGWTSMAMTMRTMYGLLHLRYRTLSVGIGEKKKDEWVPNGGRLYSLRSWCRVRSHRMIWRSFLPPGPVLTLAVPFQRTSCPMTTQTLSSSPRTTSIRLFQTRQVHAHEHDPATCMAVGDGAVFIYFARHYSVLGERTLFVARLYGNSGSQAPS